MANHSYSHLIIVCCHAIYLGPDSADEANWLIEPFQTGETATYVAHIEAGVRELAADPRAVLVFSGAATKPGRTRKSEGESYLDVAVECGLFGLETSPPMLQPRLFVDRFATDSYQNILCSIIQFPLFVRQLLEKRVQPSSLVSSPSSTSGSTLISSNLNTTTTTTAANTVTPLFPTKLTIVSHEFKRSRFLDLHLPAMHWAGETRFIGINPPFDRVKMAEIETGDRLRGYGAWEKDLYGAGELLAAKRKVRGWDEEQFRREVLDHLPSVECKMQIENLLSWNGGACGTIRYPDQMLWCPNPGS
ncbi:hypothetical protein A1O3_02801 [Capronia epimyces CBS 606.96]|uniref:DUF218 domain-containing protein n=1 Tax=Capronia epimyces CBS 606.96 TaxID=1182542 RepID=W9Z5F4_9EURO|nr:uncharacterized protein A1O3_02801 [Capronia epimyces CBS 606.96]EXJ89734.1 hypothetical protein A1O3_02801 [Capronia epimyces CBS 606.96]